MGLLDILNGMQNGPRGSSSPTPQAGGGMSPMTMAILALLAYKAVKHIGGSQPGATPAPAPSPGTGGMAGGPGGSSGGGNLGDVLKGGLGGLLAGGAAGSVLRYGRNGRNIAGAAEVFLERARYRRFDFERRDKGIGAKKRHRHSLQTWRWLRKLISSVVDRGKPMHRGAGQPCTERFNAG